jgi:hypothetical protein
MKAAELACLVVLGPLSSDGHISVNIKAELNVPLHAKGKVPRVKDRANYQHPLTTLQALNNVKYCIA